MDNGNLPPQWELAKYPPQETELELSRAKIVYEQYQQVKDKPGHESEAQSLWQLYKELWESEKAEVERLKKALQEKGKGERLGWDGVLGLFFLLAFLMGGPALIVWAIMRG